MQLCTRRDRTAGDNQDALNFGGLRVGSIRAGNQSTLPRVLVSVLRCCTQVSSVGALPPLTSPAVCMQYTTTIWFGVRMNVVQSQRCTLRRVSRRPLATSCKAKGADGE